MTKIDRLSALVSRFKIDVFPAIQEEANLFVLVDEGASEPSNIVLIPGKVQPFSPGPGQRVGFSARVDWGGSDNPLFSALPQRIDQRIENDRDFRALVSLICTEFQANRCGSASVLSRMGEVLIVKLLRSLMEEGKIRAGLLGGLSDPRLGRALVAIHETPGRIWTTADLADVAGLSVSRFTQLFREIVGTTPSSYLRRWRMTLARQDIARGDRVDTVAWRYGYGSPEALNHAFRRETGLSPVKWRHKLRDAS